MIDLSNLTKTSLLIFLFSANSSALADYTEPTAKTNVNVQTDLFEKSVGNVKALEGQIEEGKDGAIGKLNSPPNDGVEFISGKSQEEIRANSASLSAIKAGDLHEQGSAKMWEENIMEEIYIDETKPLNIQHRKDAEKIADASGRLTDKLMDLLKALDLDCKTVKGNKEIEPQYHLEIKKEVLKDTIYNQKLCEELRNKYNCSDKLKLTCKSNRGNIKEVVVPIVYKTSTEPGGWWEIYTDYTNWDPRAFDSTSTSYYRIREHDPIVQNEIKQHLANQLQVSEQYIMSVKIERQLITNRIRPYPRDTNFLVIYRDGPERCLEWIEEWTENCKLQ